VPEELVLPLTNLFLPIVTKVLPRPPRDQVVVPAADSCIGRPF